jgi:beta-hydroxylase
MLLPISLITIFGFSLGSLTYAYKFRGHVRWDDFTEYVRKGWPIFTPFNCLLYIFTQPRARKAIMDAKDFPELSLIHDNWQTIRDEAINLYKNQYFEKTKETGSQASYDIGFRTFFKYGWSKFYLTWYGHTHESAQKLCPKTVELLKQVPTVNGAMFSLLPVGSQLTRHLDPVACSLRYHLGLLTPNNDSCYINVDGQSYSWRDGEPFIFDETFLHFAKNESQQYRLILMCDVERPMYLIGSVINFFYKGLMKMTVVPNMEGDSRGLVNAIFSSLSPLLQKTKSLKQTNLFLYKVVKHTVNLTLLILVIAFLIGLIKAVQTIFS